MRGPSPVAGLYVTTAHARARAAALYTQSAQLRSLRADGSRKSPPPPPPTPAGRPTLYPVHIHLRHLARMTQARGILLQYNSPVTTQFRFKNVKSRKIKRFFFVAFVKFCDEDAFVRF